MMRPKRADFELIVRARGVWCTHATALARLRSGASSTIGRSHALKMYTRSGCRSAAIGAGSSAVAPCGGSHLVAGVAARLRWC